MFLQNLKQKILVFCLYIHVVAMEYCGSVLSFTVPWHIKSPILVLVTPSSLQTWEWLS